MPRHSHPSDAPSRFADRPPEADPALKPEDEQELLRSLQHILLREDREALTELRDRLENEQWLNSRVEPIIADRLEFLQAQFPDVYRRAVDRMIVDRLQASQEEILEVIYPKLGVMINKYVQHQFQQLKEGLEEQLHHTFNRGVLGRLKFLFGGVEKKQASETILGNLDRTQIEEVYVIDRHAGILLGNASRRQTVDLDLVAGMLTAIKSFVEDAYANGAEELEGVQYQNLTILLRSFPRFYMAVVLSGAPTTRERVRIHEDLAELADRQLRFDLRKGDGSSSYRIRRVLEKHYFTDGTV